MPAPTQNWFGQAGIVQSNTNYGLIWVYLLVDDDYGLPYRKIHGMMGNFAPPRVCVVTQPVARMKMTGGCIHVIIRTVLYYVQYHLIQRSDPSVSLQQEAAYGIKSLHN